MSATSQTDEHSSRQAIPSGSFIKNLIGFLAFPVLTVILILAAATVGVIYFENHYQDRVYPGTFVWGVDLEGMTAQEAQQALSAAFPYPKKQAFTFHDPGTGRSWSANPAQLGVQFDTEATAQAALQVGRDGNLFDNLATQFDVYLNGRHLAPVLIFDSNAAIAFLEDIAVEIYQPVQDAGIVLAQDKLITTPSQTGRQMDLAHAYHQLAAPLGELGTAEIELLIDETPPAVTDDVAQLLQAEAESLIGQPLTIYLAERTLEDDPEPITLLTADLLNMLILELDTSTTPAQYEIYLDQDVIAAWLEPLAGQLETEPQNARYIFDDDSGQLVVLQDSVPARQLDVPATVQQIIAQAATDDRQVALVIEWIKPPINEDATAAELGITELVAQGQTIFTGSSDVRVHNVATAASRFHGVVIPPGETFSFNAFLGDVTLETGFEEGLIIYGGRTIEGVGGGVCQVSTTAFQAAFYAGFPILERTPHGYRVGYYERGEGPGMDATVFYPVVDLKFVNDSPHHLLIETYTNEQAQRLTFKFYSTGDGRTVEKASVEIYNEKPHPPDLYEEDPELETGEIKQVDWSADGADVLIKRIVRDADGSVIREDNFASHYLPWQAIYHYGPETEGMPPEPEPDPSATPEPDTGS